MSRAPSNFRQSDVTRAVRAVTKAGVDIALLGAMPQFEFLGRSRMDRIGAYVKARGQWDEIQAVAPKLDIKITSADVGKPEDIEPAFKKFQAEHVEVVVVLQSNLLVLERVRIATAAVATRLPTVYGYREHVEAGGLISYG